MNIIITTIPHKAQRYDTCGDWQIADKGNVINVLVSDLGSPDYEFLVGLHELIEAYLCRKDGVDEDAVTEFDTTFAGDGEPGDDLRAPYHKQHKFASQIERYIANALGVNWDEYADAIDKLSEQSTK